MVAVNASDSEDELRAGSVVSKYRVVRKLGAGQMGSVYEVERAEGSNVALKVVRTKHVNQTEPLRRFHREATLCASLRHPNIVPVIDYGVAEGKPFLVMPILNGTDLERTIERVGPLAPDVAVAIALASARGLEHAHAASIVHRDFKPANVFLDQKLDGTLVPIVCDFGVAKALHPGAEGGITATGAVVGTPLYMSPEQLLDSKHVDARCDVWALGMTLYHMLAGQSAFAHLRSFGELLLAMRDERVPPLQAHAPWVQPSLARIVHGMLLPLQRRVAKMSDVIASLERLEPKISRLTMEQIKPITREQKALVETQALLPKSANELTGPSAENPDLPNEAHADQFLGRTLSDRYAVVSRLGLGGMGAVYEATDLKPANGAPHEVALKVMLFETGSRDAEGVKRFLREAKAAARIASPYVTQVLDTGIDQTTGSPYLVMERLRGRDLGLLLKREGCGLEPAPIVSLFLHACDALSAAHALGIVHRDVKPSNLFVHEVGDGTAVLKICDFGIAKQLSPAGAPEQSAELTRTGGLLGSPLYMSPEQAKSAKNVDARSDVFSLALSLHEALSGQRPWPGRTSMGEIIVAVCTEDVPPLQLVAPWVDARLAAAIEKGLARDASQRWQSVAEFANAIRPFGVGRTVRTSELVGISPDRASQRGLADASQRVLAETPSSQGSGQSAVAITSSQSTTIPTNKPVAAIAVGAAVLLFVGLVGGGVYLAKSRLDASSGSGMVSTIPSGASSLSSSSVPSGASSSSASPEASAALSANPVSADAGAASAASVAAVTTPPGLRPNPRPSAIPQPSASVASTPSAKPSSSVGRGMTATDLPP